MKKFWSGILTAIMAVTMIGGATVNAQQAEAADYMEATSVADVVAFVKTARPNEVMSVKLIDGVEIQYGWVWYDADEIECWLAQFSEEEMAELNAVLEEAGATVDDLYGWQLEKVTWRIVVEALN